MGRRFTTALLLISAYVTLLRGASPSSGAALLLRHQSAVSAHRLLQSEDCANGGGSCNATASVFCCSGFACSEDFSCIPAQTPERFPESLSVAPTAPSSIDPPASTTPPPPPPPPSVQEVNPPIEFRPETPPSSSPSPSPTPSDTCSALGDVCSSSSSTCCSGLSCSGGGKCVGQSEGQQQESLPSQSSQTQPQSPIGTKSTSLSTSLQDTNSAVTKIDAFASSNTQTQQRVVESIRRGPPSTTSDSGTTTSNLQSAPNNPVTGTTDNGNSNGAGGDTSEGEGSLTTDSSSPQSSSSSPHEGSVEPQRRSSDTSKKSKGAGVYVGLLVGGSVLVIGSVLSVMTYQMGQRRKRILSRTDKTLSMLEDSSNIDKILAMNSASEKETESRTASSVGSSTANGDSISAANNSPPGSLDLQRVCQRSLPRIPVSTSVPMDSSFSSEDASFRESELFHTPVSSAASLSSSSSSARSLPSTITSIMVNPNAEGSDLTSDYLYCASPAQTHGALDSVAIPTATVTPTGPSDPVVSNEDFRIARAVPIVGEISLSGGRYMSRRRADGGNFGRRLLGPGESLVVSPPAPFEGDNDVVFYGRTPPHSKSIPLVQAREETVAGHPPSGQQQLHPLAMAASQQRQTRNTTERQTEEVRPTVTDFSFASSASSRPSDGEVCLSRSAASSSSSFSDQ